jgi:hypothetical protein
MVNSIRILILFSSAHPPSPQIPIQLQALNQQTPPPPPEIRKQETEIEKTIGKKGSTKAKNASPHHGYRHHKARASTILGESCFSIIMKLVKKEQKTPAHQKQTENRRPQLPVQTNLTGKAM